MQQQEGEPAGSARLELVDGVVLLRPEDAVLQAMLRGWEAQQVGGRGLQRSSVRDRLGVVRRFLTYTNEFPWHWTPAHLDEWMVDLVSHSGRAKSTIRNYQDAVRSFCDFLVRPEYHWAAECETRFGTHPVQICFEWNTLAHLTNYEGHPDRRPMTREELQRFFDHADTQVESAVRRRRKGALAAYRDATLFKVMYAYGLRVREATRLDVTDWYRNPKAPELGRYGNLEVRWGKASRGSPPRRRTVHTVMPWIVEVLEDYVANVLPRYGFPDHPALWLTERGGRVMPRSIEQRFVDYRTALKLDAALVPHCLRHSHVTHQIEDGIDPKFVQEQVGHRYASTTAIYTGVSGDFMNTMMRSALDKVSHSEKTELR
ncbi:tyrosine-type recombinase/integrase [Amycolatopsis sp. DG1A-15b]|uniref:tyrosine-type recombinase/integrase n=1 Tax=Amycolatopsis sp. DG1A-15b TaxID=3052846 RepID=UPI00255BDBED|nr:tyrosine-type recombinase/integrase [Amycolatopsis sp. DG1A-15b]WIX85685.1 tyrosine-type recombinase/integrase [Amycolatopsis sp. DG1A-15b]